MKTITVIIADLFEDSEYVEPARAFHNVGHALVHIGFTASSKPRYECKRGKI